MYGMPLHPPLLRQRGKGKKPVAHQGGGLVIRSLAWKIQDLEQHGKIMHAGMIVDATIIEAPTSAKNTDNQRDPEMYQVRKNRGTVIRKLTEVG